MLEEKCNIWDKYNQGYNICITTNGYVKKNRRCVMGRGVAKQALDRFPNIDQNLAFIIFVYGNTVQLIQERIYAFPVKPTATQCSIDKSNIVSHMRHKFEPFNLVPGWAAIADIHLIRQSLDKLLRLHKRGLFNTICLPRPGCGAGGLDWSNQVRALCKQYGDWLICCTL